MAIKYPDKYMYLYPPRPDNKIEVESLNTYDNGEYLAQPKYNGSCCNVFMDGKGFIKVMNRHKQELTRVDLDNIDFAGAYRGEGWIVLCGELLNKNKKGEDGKPFNQKFIIWEILVYNGQYLVNSTFEERMKFLDLLFPCVTGKVSSTGLELTPEHLCDTGIKNIYRAPTYVDKFTSLYNDLIKTDVYEGLVVKKKNGILEFGTNERNNHSWQFKCRKPAKNYHY